MLRKMISESKDQIKKVDSRMYYLLDWKKDIPSDWEYDF